MTENIVVSGSVEIPKAVLRREDDALLLKELTLYSKYRKDEAIRAYQETPDSYIVPRFWFVDKLAVKYRHMIVNKDPALPVRAKWTFNGQLRSHQSMPKYGLTPVPSIPAMIERYRGIFVSAPCGSGKTVSAIYIIAKLGVPAIVVTPNEAVRDQWLNSLRKFLGGARITQYDGRKKDLSGDVVVASLQLISMKPLTRDFPFYILDEAHMAAAPEFQKAMFNVNYRYSLALTATGDRFDKLDPLFKMPLSCKTVELDTDQLPITCIFRPVLYTSEERQAYETFRSMELDNQLMLFERRNIEIVKAVSAAYQRGRKIMVLSKSILQLRVLRQVFTALHPEAKTSRYSGEVTRFGKVVPDLARSADEIAEDEQYLDDPDAVLFSTFGKAGTGYDNVEKDAIIFAQNILDVRQAIGRVQRSSPGKNPPLAIFFIDDLQQMIDRATGMYWGGMAPLGKHRCALVNECPFLLEQLGQAVTHRVKPELKSRWLKSRQEDHWTNS